MNLTATQPTAGGYLTASPYGQNPLKVSNPNFGPGQTVANLTLVNSAESGLVSYYDGSGGYVQMVADVFGYYATE